MTSCYYTKRDERRTTGCIALREAETVLISIFRSNQCPPFRCGRPRFHLKSEFCTAEHSLELAQSLSQNALRIRRDLIILISSCRSSLFSLPLNLQLSRPLCLLRPVLLMTVGAARVVPASSADSGLPSLRPLHPGVSAAAALRRRHRKERSHGTPEYPISWSVQSNERGGRGVWNLADGPESG